MDQRLPLSIIVVMLLVGSAAGSLSDGPALAMQSDKQFELIPLQIMREAESERYSGSPPGWEYVDVVFGIKNVGIEPLTVSWPSEGVAATIAEGRTYAGYSDVSNDAGGGYSRNEFYAFSYRPVPPGVTLCGEIDPDAGAVRFRAGAKIPVDTSVTELFVPGYPPVDLTQPEQPDACGIDDSVVTTALPWSTELVGTSSETSRAQLEVLAPTFRMTEKDCNGIRCIFPHEILAVDIRLTNLDKFDDFGFGFDSWIIGDNGFLYWRSCSEGGAFAGPGQIGEGTAVCIAVGEVFVDIQAGDEIEFLPRGPERLLAFYSERFEIFHFFDIGDEAIGLIAEDSAEILPTDDLVYLLPVEADVPLGLILIGDEQRTLREVSQSYSDPKSLRERFTELGWQRNVFREFMWPEEESPPSAGTAYLYVSIHQFRDVLAATEALDYAFADSLARYSGNELPIEAVGDTARAMTSSDAEGNYVDLYVQDHDVLIIVAAMSPEGDPMNDVMGIAKTVLAANTDRIQS